MEETAGMKVRRWEAAWCTRNLGSGATLKTEDTHLHVGCKEKELVPSLVCPVPEAHSSTRISVDSGSNTWSL